jgi:hypothetical protein
MKKLLLILILLTSCSTDDDNEAKQCECTEKIYEYNIQIDPLGNEVNTGAFIEEVETECGIEANYVVQNNDYPEVDSELLFIARRCN